ncbi:MAG: dienelactone hydrolase family protein [Rhodanobacter sp.]|nr:dienelactone hydrolase family protein [Rhodanobacter sp.]
MTLSCIELETAPNPTYAVILLHGLGADGNDFAPIVPQLVDRTWPALRFVFPHAPERPVTVNGGMHMRAWYDIENVDIADRQDEAGIRVSIAHLNALITRETARGIPSDRVILAGFSQGGAIVLAGSVRHARPLAGVVALSSYLPIATKTAEERSAANANLPIFMGHGSFDPVVPQTLGILSRDALSASGHPVQWHSYPMAHQVCPAEIADLRAWMSTRLLSA